MKLPNNCDKQRSQRNSLKYNVHYRDKNSLAGSQEDMESSVLVLVSSSLVFFWKFCEDVY